MIEPRGDFQRFAVGVYGRDGVPAASLLLQDCCGVDVNVLLLAAYVGAARAATFGSADVASAVASTRQWQRDVVGPLRGVRMRLRDGPPPAPDPATAALRDRIKAAELGAEMIELDVLADVVAGVEFRAADGGADHRATAAMHAVLRHGSTNEPTDEQRAAITVIAVAAADISKGAGG